MNTPKKNLQFARQLEPNNQAIQQRLAQVQQWRHNKQPSLPATLAQEQATNPFLRCHEISIKQAAEAYSGYPLNDEIEIFAILRQWKDHF
jgi:hydroxyacylglutathione hydrolase